MSRFHVAARPLRARALVLLVLALLGAAAAMPATSAAAIRDCSNNACPRDTSRDLPASHVGWVQAPDTSPMCATLPCPRSYGVRGWSWNGASWRPALVPFGWVYVYPYASGWRWAWTQQTGWVAISSTSLLIAPGAAIAR